MNAQNKQFQDARTLYCSHSYGILSTHSTEMEGYPFGSIVPYCLDYNGEPLILISNIAQHTKNIAANEKVSLTIFYATDGIDPQSNARLTYLADAEKISAADYPDSYERYYRNLPHTRDYHKTHDFNLFRLSCKRARYIGGFGKIFWIEKTDLIAKNPFSPQEELEIINHMNQDHQKALSKYFVKVGVDPENKLIELCGIDAEGIDLLLNKEKKVRILLPFPVSNIDEARKALIEMSKI